MALPIPLDIGKLLSALKCVPNRSLPASRSTARSDARPIAIVQLYVAINEVVNLVKCKPPVTGCKVDQNFPDPPRCKHPRILPHRPCAEHA